MKPPLRKGKGCKGAARIKKQVCPPLAEALLLSVMYSRRLAHRSNPFVQQFDRFLIDPVAADHWHPPFVERFDSMQHQ